MYMGLHERAEKYLASKGLTTEDAGKVVGAFLVAKYTVLLMTFPFCHRYKPIRSLLQPVRLRYLQRKKQFGDVARRKLSQEALRTEGWRSRLGRTTLEYMDKLAEAAARRSLWQNTASFFGIEPKAFAMTVAEALVFYKITFLFLGPLTFFSLVKLYQRERPPEVAEFLKDYNKDLVDVVVEPEPAVSHFLKRISKQD